MVKLFKVALTLSVFMHLTDATLASDNSLGDDISKRPAQVQENIDMVFKDISSDRPTFNYYGRSNYDCMGIDESPYVSHLVEISKEREILILDVGAGNCAWSKNKAFQINQKKHVDRTVHFISVNGENSSEEHIEDGSCFRHNFGSVKIENLDEEMPGLLKRCGLSADSQFDLAVSRMTFLHLCDPLGSFLRLHKLVKIKGHMLMDGFPVLYRNDENNRTTLKYIIKNSMNDPEFEKQLEAEINLIPSLFDNMIQLLIDTKEPFLIRSWFLDGVFPEFLLRKEHETLEIPLVYDRVVDGFKCRHTKPKSVASFIRSDMNDRFKGKLAPSIFSSKHCFSGYQELFTFLQECRCLSGTDKQDDYFVSLIDEEATKSDNN